MNGDGNSRRNRSAEEETERRQKQQNLKDKQGERRKVIQTDWMSWRDFTPGEKLRTNIPTLTDRELCL